MKKLLTVLLLFISTILFSQKNIQYYDIDWKETISEHATFYSVSQKTDTGWYQQAFYISLKKLRMVGLCEDKESKMRNGRFYWVYPNNQFERIGGYAHNKREGVWMDYYSDGSLKDSLSYHDDHLVGKSVSWYKNSFPKDSSDIDAQGNGVFVSWFDNGQPSSAGRYVDFDKKNGKWQYFHRNGHVSAIEVYDHDNLKSRQYFDEKGNVTSDTVSHDKRAQFPGGAKGWDKYLSTHLHFPSQFEFQNSEGAIVVVSGIINEEGKVVDAEVSIPCHPKFDEITLNAIKKSPPWEPAIDHNRKVCYYFSEAINFSQSFHD